MLRRNTILTTAALLAVCAVPASAQTYDDLRSPDAKDAAREAGVLQEPTQDLRSPDAEDAAGHRGLYDRDNGPYVLERSYGSPDAVDAGRNLPPVQIPAPVVEVRELPSGGFDWGDAGIGAAGMLALFSIAAGSALLISGRKRRRGFRVAIH
ncbi:MAG: hypothetical protein ACRDNL_10305 [Spirillospora sp.]